MFGSIPFYRCVTYVRALYIHGTIYMVKMLMSLLDVHPAMSFIINLTIGSYNSIFNN